MIRSLLSRRDTGPTLSRAARSEHRVGRRELVTPNAVGSVSPLIPGAALGFGIPEIVSLVSQKEVCGVTASRRVTRVADRASGDVTEVQGGTHSMSQQSGFSPGTIDRETAAASVVDDAAPQPAAAFDAVDLRPKTLDLISGKHTPNYAGKPVHTTPRVAS
jgi:hypothetical protein